MTKADRSTGCVAHKRSRYRAKIACSALARAMVLTSVALGIPACEVVSGLNGLDPVDCLTCDVAQKAEASGDVELADASVRDTPLETAPDAVATDARDMDVEGPGDADLSDRGRDVNADVALGDEGRADSADNGVDTGAHCSNQASDCGSCRFAHDNGVGQNYSDCTPVGTYSNPQAMAACAAYTGNSAECRSATCGAASVVCSSGETNSCACWAFAGAGAGHVSLAAQPGTLGCACPGPTAPTWN